MGFFLFLMLLEIADKIYCRDSLTPCTRVRCGECYTLGNCIPDDETGFTYDQNAFDICPGNTICDGKTLFCAQQGFCRYEKFECPTTEFDEEILFPDPYSCNLYHGCLKSRQYDYVCEKGTAFSPITKNCSVEFDGRSCDDFVIPFCKNAEQSGYIPGTNFTHDCVKDNTLAIVHPKTYLRKATTTDGTVSASFKPTTTARSSTSCISSSVTEKSSTATAHSKNTFPPSGGTTETVKDATDGMTNATEERTEETIKVEILTTAIPIDTERMPATETEELTITTNENNASTTIEILTSPSEEQKTTEARETPIPTKTETMSTTINEESSNFTTESNASTTIELPTSTRTDDNPTASTNTTIIAVATTESSTSTSWVISTTERNLSSKWTTSVSISQKTSEALKTTTTSTSITPFVCPGRGYFPDKNDCHSFHKCRRRGSIFRRLRCRNGSYFDPLRRVCALGSCPKPSSSATSTTPSTNRRPFACPHRGIFPDSEDCRGFYRCPVFGSRYRHLRCRAGSHFDSMRERCVRGPC